MSGILVAIDVFLMTSELIGRFCLKKLNILPWINW